MALASILLEQCKLRVVTLQVHFKNQIVVVFLVFCALFE